jgi:hypothetical protein
MLVKRRSRAFVKSVATILTPETQIPQVGSVEELGGKGRGAVRTIQGKLIRAGVEINLHFTKSTPYFCFSLDIQFLLQPG